MSAFRSLAPSDQQPNSSDSSSSKTPGFQSGNSTSTRATSREATGGTDSGAGAAEDGEKGSGGPEEPLRKRRTPGTVAGRACKECRQARQRCDGEEAPVRQPQTPCGRCRQRSLRCVFEENTKTQKEILIGQLKNAQSHNDELRFDVSSRDTRIRDLQQSNDSRGDILSTIGSNGHDQEIIQRLRDGQSYQQISEWLRHEIPEFRYLGVSPGDTQTLTEVVQIFEADCRTDDGNPPLDGLIFSKDSWTEVSSDSKMISRLLDLYFAYVHPVHMLFSELDFKRDFQANHPVHCSRPLVNAICAMACHLYEHKQVGDGKFVDLQTNKNLSTLRQGFLDEAKRSLIPTYYKLMTSVQAFAILYLVDMSSGKARTALGYLEAALEGLCTIGESRQSQEAKELSFWGLRTIKTCSVGMTFRNLEFPFADHQLEFKGVDLSGDAQMWRRYHRPGQEIPIPRRPAYSVVTAYYQARLFNLIDDNLNLYCGRPHSLTADLACSQYRKYLAWEETLPPPLKHINGDPGPPPHVLYLHVQYQTAIVQHLSPIVQSGYFQGSDLHTLREFVVSHAWKGLELLQMAQHLYTSRFVLPLITFCTIYLGDALLVQSAHWRHAPPNKGGPQVLRICLELLQQTRAGFPLCGPLQMLFHERAVKYDVQIPTGMGEILGSFTHYNVDSMLDTCTRLSYTLPMERLIPLIHPKIAEEWPAAWRGPSTQRVVNVASLLNND